VWLKWQSAFNARADNVPRTGKRNPKTALAPTTTAPRLTGYPKSGNSISPPYPKNKTMIVLTKAFNYVMLNKSFLPELPTFTPL
jgi:hypothetical protein